MDRETNTKGNRDVVSDPAHSDDEDRDWCDEGGAVGTGQVSEVVRLDPADADTPISDSEATSGYPPSESGEAQEPAEAGPNADPHRDQSVR